MEQIAAGRIGVFRLEYTEWSRKTAADKTWTDFKLDFTTVHRDLLVDHSVESNHYNQVANAVIEAFESRTNEAIDRLEHFTSYSAHSDILTTQVDNTATEVSSLRDTVILLQQ